MAGSAELLTITCPSLTVAENMADLVDGYCRMVNNATNSIWNRKGGCDDNSNSRDANLYLRKIASFIDNKYDFYLSKFPCTYCNSLLTLIHLKLCHGKRL